jgi:Flp pilus assembly protein TadD
MILLDPACAVSHLISGVSHFSLNRCEEALLELRRYHALAEDASSLTALAYGLARAGQHGQALAMLDELIELRKRTYVCADRLAIVYIGLGNRLKALDWLELLAEERAASRVELRVNPIWDDLRGEPRFRSFVERLGLPAHPLERTD